MLLDLSSEPSLAEFVSAWETLRMPEGSWTHAAHVATCAYYAAVESEEATYRLMRSGILAFNEGTGTPNTDSRGYHDGMTRKWVATIWPRVHGMARIEAARSAVAAFGGMRFSRERT